MNQKVPVAIIGTGGIAPAHMEGLKALAERAEVVAAADIDEARVAAFCQKFSIPGAYTDVADMLVKTRPRLVHICTPPGAHCDLTVKSLEAGAWVLCEKPLCASLAELDRIADAEQRTGNYCSSVFQMRFGSAAAHLRKLMADGALGRPLVGLCNTTWYRTHEYYAVPWRGKWSTELGGPTMIHGIHTMDLFFYLMGDWQEVRAMIGTLDRKIKVEDVSMAIVRFESGAMGSIVNSVLCPRGETSIRLDFQKATVEGTFLYSYTNTDWKCTPLNNDAAIAALWNQIGPEIPTTHGVQTAAMLDALERNVRPPVSGAEARRVIEFATCMYKAAVTGQPVRRGSIAKDDPFYHHVAGTLALSERT
jgi:predicted dehydrogenase